MANNSQDSFEKQYRALLEEMGFGIAVYESKDCKKFIFKDFSKLAEKIDKVKKKDLMGKDVLDIFPGAKDMGIIEAFQKACKTGKLQVLPMRAYKDKRIQAWRDNYIFRTEKGTIKAIYKDKTEQKQEEEKEKKIEDKLREDMVESKKMNELMVGRELKMAELKREIMELKKKLGGKNV